MVNSQSAIPDPEEFMKAQMLASTQMNLQSSGGSGNQGNSLNPNTLNQNKFSGAFSNSR